MPINLITRNLARSHCKNPLLLKTVYSAATEYQKFVNKCSCSRLTFTLTSQFYSTDGKNHGRNTSKADNKFVSACKRFFSAESGPPSTKLPPLMNFPEIIWPSVLKSIRNFILATFIIKPYLDREFNLPDFVKGSKKAVEIVSGKLAEGDMKSLDGLVTNDIIPNLQKSISRMSLLQREQIGIQMEDIYFSFPYQVGIIFNEEDGQDHKRFVEITMVYHTLRGLAVMRSQGEEPPINMGMLPEYRARISVCNYRFIREFTKGVEGDWTVNLLNHFKPADFVDE